MQATLPLLRVAPSGTEHSRQHKPILFLIVPLKPFSLVENANRLNGLYWAIHPEYFTEALQEVLWNVTISKVKTLLIFSPVCVRIKWKANGKTVLKKKKQHITKSANIKYSLTQPSQRPDIYLDRFWHGIKSRNCPSLLQASAEAVLWDWCTPGPAASLA